MFVGVFGEVSVLGVVVGCYFKLVGLYVVLGVWVGFWCGWIVF